MARRQIATLLHARPSPPFWELSFSLERAPEAGEYLLADLGGPVREPLFPSAIDDAGFTTAVAPGHPALRLLPGTMVDVLGPLGRGFRLTPAGHPLARLLLMAQVESLPMIRPLFQAAPSVALVVEATTRAQLPTPDRFPPTLELVLVTLDGSTGYLGPLASPFPYEGGRRQAAGVGWDKKAGENERAVPAGLERVGTRLRELIAWAECVCVAHDLGSYPSLAGMVKDVRLQPFSDFAQALVRVPMPCGVGVCDVCRVATRRGELRACVDGPVLDLLDFLSL